MVPAATCAADQAAATTLFVLAGVAIVQAAEQALGMSADGGPACTSRG